MQQLAKFVWCSMESIGLYRAVGVSSRTTFLGRSREGALEELGKAERSKVRVIISHEVTTSIRLNC